MTQDAFSKPIFLTAKATITLSYVCFQGLLFHSRVALLFITTLKEFRFKSQPGNFLLPDHGAGL